jgi:FixJ family two-component response regulator
VILTAHGDDEVRERARRAGVVAFLDKPVKSAVLIEGVQSALLRATGGSSVDES